MSTQTTSLAPTTWPPTDPKVQVQAEAAAIACEQLARTLASTRGERALLAAIARADWFGPTRTTFEVELAHLDREDHAIEASVRAAARALHAVVP